VLLGTNGGPKVTPTLSLLQVIGYNLLIVSAVLVPAGAFHHLPQPLTAGRTLFVRIRCTRGRRARSKAAKA